MADFLNIETPQQVLARQRNQRIQQAGTNRDLRRQATALNALESVFGTPESDKAAALESAIGSAQKAFVPDEEADQITNEIARLRQVRDAVEDVDVNTFTQVNQRLLELSIAQEEQGRLRAQERRAQGAEGRAQAAADREEAIFSSEGVDRQGRVIVDANTGESLGQIDLDNPEDVQRLAEIRASNPNAVPQSMDDFLDARQEDRIARLRIREAAKRVKAAGGASQAIERRRLSASAEANNSFANTADNFLELIETSPSAFGIGGQAVAGLQRVGAHAKSFVGALAPEAVELNDNLIDTKLEEAGIADAQRRSLVIDLAYAIATSREGGRLTDQDVDRAIETMGGANPDPRAIVEVMGGLVDRRAEEWADRLVISGLTDDEAAQAMHKVVADRFTQAQTRAQGLRERFTPINPESAAPTDRAQTPPATAEPTFRFNPVTGKVEQL